MELSRKEKDILLEIFGNTISALEMGGIEFEDDQDEKEKMLPKIIEKLKK